MIVPVDCTSSTPLVVEYRIGEIQTQSMRSLVREAAFCALERNVMLIGNQMVTLTSEMRAYLEYEAARRGIDISSVYEEEMESQKRVNQHPLTPEELRLLVEKSNPDPRLLEGDEECPF
jgi:hypothetical protein